MPPRKLKQATAGPSKEAQQRDWATEALRKLLQPTGGGLPVKHKRKTLFPHAHERWASLLLERLAAEGCISVDARGRGAPKLYTLKDEKVTQSFIDDYRMLSYLLWPSRMADPRTLPAQNEGPPISTEALSLVGALEVDRGRIYSSTSGVGNAMARLKDVTPTRSKPAKTQLYVDLDLAKLIRRAASAEQRELSPLIKDMFVLYLRTTHPSPGMTDDEIANVHRREPDELELVHDPAEATDDRCRQLVRALSIGIYLGKGKGETLYDLATMFSVTPRTIRRDLAALAGVGVAVESKFEGSGKTKTWSVNPAATVDGKTGLPWPIGGGPTPNQAADDPKITDLLEAQLKLAMGTMEAVADLTRAVTSLQSRVDHFHQLFCDQMGIPEEGDDK